MLTTRRILPLRMPAMHSFTATTLLRASSQIYAPRTWVVRPQGTTFSSSQTPPSSPDQKPDATSSNSSEPGAPLPPTTSFVDTVVAKLNHGIRNHPAETIAVLFASDIGSIGAMYGLLSVSGIEFSPEFALAFAASRPFRRLRLPLDLASAAVVSKLVPALSRVRLSELANVMPSRPSASAGSTASQLPPLVTKSMDKVFGVVDSYGAAYMMGSRLMGVSVVSVLYVLIKQGVDVMPLLAQLGVDNVGTALGSYAAAVVFSSAFYPVTLGVTGYIVPVVAGLRKTLRP